jgi:hypothetical protein
MFPHFAGPMARGPLSISPEFPISFSWRLWAIVCCGVNSSWTSSVRRSRESQSTTYSPTTDTPSLSCHKQLVVVLAGGATTVDVRPCGPGTSRRAAGPPAHVAGESSPARQSTDEPSARKAMAAVRASRTHCGTEGTTRQQQRRRHKGCPVSLCSTGLVGLPLYTPLLQLPVVSMVFYRYRSAFDRFFLFPVLM